MIFNGTKWTVRHVWHRILLLLDDNHYQIYITGGSNLEELHGHPITADILEQLDRVREKCYIRVMDSYLKIPQKKSSSNARNARASF